MKSRTPRPAWLPAAVFLLAAWFGATSAFAGVPTCAGDCDEDSEVSTVELRTAVEIALGDLSLEVCDPADADGDQLVTVDDIVFAVNERASACNFQTPTPSPTPQPPDLVPDSARLLATPPSGGCIGSLDEIHASIEVCVRNDGGGPSAAFQVDAEGNILDFAALPAGERECVEFPSLGFPGGVDVIVDPQQQIAELDESNNEAHFPVPVLTPPLTCTATATHTPLPPGTPSDTPTSTRTPTHTLAPTNTATPSETPFPTGTRTPSPTPTQTPSPTTTATPELPDLIPTRIVVVAPTPVGGCVHNLSEVQVSLLLCVFNDSTGAAGPFESTLRVTGAVSIPFPDGAQPDAEVCVSSPPFTSGLVSFEVDTQHQVAEKNEENNEAVFLIERPTPPPICPTVTPTPPP